MKNSNLVNKNGLDKLGALPKNPYCLPFLTRLAIWVWAHAFNWLGAFETLEQSLYFSMVAFTTLGFGDVTLPQEWRLLSGIIAANGLVLFGLNTAFLIEILSRVLKSDD